jgi:excisionase family DNA binding protein
MMDTENTSKQLDELKRLVLLGATDVLNVDDLCLLLGTTRKNVYRMTSEKQIPFYKPLRGKIYFKREEIEAWLLRNRSASIDEIESKAELLCITTN